jgi:hypothetical protein
VREGCTGVGGGWRVELTDEVDRGTASIESWRGRQCAIVGGDPGGCLRHGVVEGEVRPKEIGVKQLKGDTHQRGGVGDGGGFKFGDLGS